jgi:CzcA family heavy metal efflux pump
MTQWAYYHRRSILFALCLFAIAGLFTIFKTPVSLFPQVIFPRIVINMDAGDRPAERMMVEATWPVEEAVRTVPGVVNVRSNTSRGSADISINFVWGLDMVSAMLQVESAINQIRSKLPATLAFTVRRMEPTVFPVLGYSLTSTKQSQVELRDIAQYQIRPVLSAIPGVANIEVLGGAVAEYQVIVNPAKLVAFGLNLDDIAKGLTAANIIHAVGRLEQDYKLYLGLTNTQFENAQQISKTIIRKGSNGLVFLDDIAQVIKTTAPQWQRVTADGKDAVLFQLIQQPDGSTVEIAHAVQKQLDVIQKKLPADIKIAKWYDQSDLIVASAINVREALIIGLALAVIVLFVFLRNGKVTLIVAITVPVVLSATALVLYITGQSFNIMTLGGMAAAVALIIDDAIVMIEHIVRRMQNNTGSYLDRIQFAAEEFTKPLAASSGATIVTHIPLAFLSGVSGSFFKALSLTIASVLAISFLVSWLAVPLLASHTFTEKDTEPKAEDKITRWLHQHYERIMLQLLPRPWLILLALLPLLVGGFLAYQNIGSGFMPAMDEGGFILDYRAAPGTSVSETDRLLRQVEAILQHTPEVETYSRRTGLSLGGHITEANEGDFFVRLKPLPRRGLNVIMDDVRAQVLTNVPGLDVEMAKLMEDMIGDLTAVPEPIEIKLYSDDGEVLAALAEKVAQELEKIAGVVDINNGVIPAGDALDINVLRDRAAIEGLSVEDVNLALNSYLTGAMPTQVQEGIKMINVRVWLPENKRSTSNALTNLRIRAPDGHWVPLKRIAEITVETGQAQIKRDNLKRMVAVTARISGRDLGSTIADITKVLDQPNMLPRDVYYVLGGLYEQQQVALKGMIAVFLSAVALVFVLILYLYESFPVALAMILTTLLSVTAVFIGLFLTHTELNIMAIMGMTMVIGIVTEVAIFYYSEYESLPEKLTGIPRLVMAGNNRMRPIIMTSLAAIFALLPLAIGIGAGSEMLKPLAIAIVSGLMVQIPLVLIMLPAFLVLNQNR